MPETLRDIISNLTDERIDKNKLLLVCLWSLLRTTQGRVLIDGKPLGDMNDRQRTRFRREKIGFTFQSNNLISYLTSLENVQLMLRLNGKNVCNQRGPKNYLFVWDWSHNSTNCLLNFPQVSNSGWPLHVLSFMNPALFSPMSQLPIWTQSVPIR